MADLLSYLNPEQRAAVTLPDEPALILAGAGSGKTRVLTTRIAWLIQTGRINPAQVLAVTFTNKAAREMIARLSALLPLNPRGMWIGTFHGLCNRLLRVHCRAAGLPATFQILDIADQLSALKRLLKGLNLDSEKYPPKQLQNFINHAKEEGLRPSKMDVDNPFNRKFVELYEAYEIQCQREGAVDFAELLLRSYELLAREVSLREHYQARFQHILVDEFQDTNRLQYQWLKLLAGSKGAVFAVGDDDQSIYGFRGANVGNMLDFQREFEVRNLIKLEQNYRSHGHILDAANGLIANNAQRLGKNLYTEAGAGEPVRVYRAETDTREANWLGEEIHALIEQGGALDQIALLYRSNAQSRVFEHMLVSQGIPYRVYGGLRFFERQEIKHALAYLRLLDNLDDDTSFLRVVNFPTRGIGARALEQLNDMARLHQCSLAAAVTYVGGKTGANLIAFVQFIEQMRHATQAMSLPEVVEYITQTSGLIPHYETEREGQDRIENLRELVNAAVAFVAENGDELNTPARSIPLAPGATPAAQLPVNESAQISLTAEATDGMTPLSAFLSHASLEAGDNQAQTGQNAVQLMTVHAAKGLEFNAVFITGLEEGLFPHQNSTNDANSLEEERRLMYVAITRAKKRLYLSFAESRMLHGQTRYNVGSRFIDELPTEGLKWLTSKRDSFAQNSMTRSRDENSWGRNWFAKKSTQEVRVAPSALEARQRTAATGFWIGQAVFHTKFGEGTVAALEGNGAEARAQVNFSRHGAKWLALAVAKLQPIDD
ncbi:UvrD/REP helicase [Mycoavidus cysteinexigens]|uniref:DNA 3'-5' helicase n=1 Tax=Mycoavidus cysteinexigens TaxID=1553431 RepID=A0A2Z6EUN5_9BURK|nr:UvrD-helicase domain-containing protein [Mycoavidus cysteinexigens]BBE09122.1 UvrD/REP helicase [Mycoavidus cysteinexigens]GAM52137.1 ATP-dependent DNA helicase UvrD/PcrA [bacterium endosymbiont of Mortierella elongata FMR23-6]GLR00214.1 DNA helicase [Mycoavidus cysteinexigens]